MNHSSVIWIIVLILIILVVVAQHGKKNMRESFETTSWGYVPESDAPVVNDAERRYIVGPDPNCDQITGWQYNPQNTQVDYHFYRENRDLNYYAKTKVVCYSCMYFTTESAKPILCHSNLNIIPRASKSSLI